MGKRVNYKKMRANIPNKVKLHKATYEVLWSADFHFDGDRNEKGKTYGITRFDPKQIVLNTNQPDKEAVFTYFHEIIHGLSHEVDANLTENQVRALEKGFPSLRDLIKTLEGNE